MLLGLCLDVWNSSRMFFESKQFGLNQSINRCVSIKWLQFRAGAKYHSAIFSHALDHPNAIQPTNEKFRFLLMLMKNLRSGNDSINDPIQTIFSDQIYLHFCLSKICLKCWKIALKILSKLSYPKRKINLTFTFT